MSGVFMPWFPDPGTYISQYQGVDANKQPIYKYRQLLWKRDPLIYPYRFAEQEAGNKSNNGISFDELEVSVNKRHVYLAYLGVKPGFIFYLWHPYDFKLMKWDEDIKIISEDLVAAVTYETSPYEYPTKLIGIESDRYPNVQPKNVSGETKQAEIVWVAAKYKVREHEDLTDDELQKLQARQLRAYPIDFGGEL